LQKNTVIARNGAKIRAPHRTTADVVRKRSQSCHQLFER